MNAKKAKALREVVRVAFGKDPKDVDLDGRYHHRVFNVLFRQRVLTKHCGRAVYRNLKNFARAGHIVPAATPMRTHEAQHIESELATA